MLTIQESIEQLHSALCDYIEATYHISAPSLIRQRKELLDRPEVISQIPYLESTPRYVTGESFNLMKGLPEAALEAYMSVSEPDGELPRLVYDPPYRHQSDAVRATLVDGGNIVIMTGTGSGKTEAFLLPILGKLACEAKNRPASFEYSAMRTLILYPMNALVNDQLGRLRALLGDPRLVDLFKNWAGRPPRFARYTSRTPYAGVRTPEKDSAKLRMFNNFFADIQRSAETANGEDGDAARQLLKDLKKRGKWPAKPDLASWIGRKGTRWKNSAGEFIRAVTLPDDSELLTRHEVQESPPDLLITNYSMLEYMLMRPIERPVFDRTREWLSANPEEKFLVVMDEAHLYRGAPGAEVGLLLRRLRDRLGISADRFQVICSTASFSDSSYAPSFGAQLSGVPAETFTPISGSLDLNPEADPGTDSDARILASIDLQKYYAAETDSERINVVRALLDCRGVSSDCQPEVALYRALKEFAPMGLLVNLTMKEALPVSQLATKVFPDSSPRTADEALTVLLALGSMARAGPESPGLLPCRIHNFFRGLPGLWVCMDPDCGELREELKDGICGRMYGQPRELCGCGGRVLEFFTCRNCGTAYARAYTDDVDTPSALWSEPGHRLRMQDGETHPLLPLDILLEPPVVEDLAEPADYDIETGRLNPQLLGSRMRIVHIAGNRVSVSTDEDDESEDGLPARGQFRPCAVCGTTAAFNRSSVQNHQTSGDQPFQVLVSRQVEIQPPAPVKPTRFAPLQGRKVLVFSDSRQVAARLAPNLQMYSLRDSLRVLIAWGYHKLQGVARLDRRLSLEDLYFSVLLASNKLKVRLRPETGEAESFDAELKIEKAVTAGETETDAGLEDLYMEFLHERPPESLLGSIVTTVGDRFLGLEPLALASIGERRKHTKDLEQLPPIPGVAETPEAKVGLARTWLRCWRNHGFWLNSMPVAWWRRPRAEGVNVRGHPSGNSSAMRRIIEAPDAWRIFRNQWVPRLLDLFTEHPGGGNERRLVGRELSLVFEGRWVRCKRCKSVHRPVPGFSRCLDCNAPSLENLDPDSNSAFLARKGFYRRPVTAALGEPPCSPMALIAAEHTAQLNAPQSEDVFSKAEENELFFQDIDLGEWAERSTAIDVLSSTTTMEVGIDIGSLLGVSLRNMPPTRANYQQRAGRAGRRGNAVATVVAFGSADSHDEHYFSEPDSMIRGEVVDPRLTLDNVEIARRHIRAFVLQNYHQDRIPGVDAGRRSNLFSVLGTVSDFCSEESVLNRGDFKLWISQNEAQLRQRALSWIPEEFSPDDRKMLLSEMGEDCLGALDDAIRFNAEGESQPGENVENLLDRLLYCGKLPRYAFPTDVATFHVFDRDRSSGFRPVTRFAPSQGLPVALSQYAPGKQVWISGKCYTSGAIYSVMAGELYSAWNAKRIYMECNICGFARTFKVSEADRGDVRNCEACGGAETLGPGRYWLRPPGFAHPVDVMEVTSPDDMPETSYATRAKLTMSTPDENEDWTQVNENIRILKVREHLLVSNSGPRNEGYTYCTKCGRIEPDLSPGSALRGDGHRKPYPTRDGEETCDGGGTTRHMVLGTDFITDIALFSMRVAPPLRLTPGVHPTVVALRTASEALAVAACQMLEVEGDELMASFRPALTHDGIMGIEAEIFLYDVLPGGAGFAGQLVNHGHELFNRALELLKNCPENCDASCYRCLRRFKNKFEHGLLDRHVGAELLEYLISGKHGEFNKERIRMSTVLLGSDLMRQASCIKHVRFEALIDTDSGKLKVPILITTTDEREFVVALSSPLVDDRPTDRTLTEFCAGGGGITFILENELLVRSNLPAATQKVLERIQGP